MSNIYSHILNRKIENKSLGDMVKDGMSMRQMAMQNEAGEQKLAEDERKRKTQASLQAMETLAGMSPEQRAAEYPKMREQMIQSGMMRPEDGPPEHDEGHFQRYWGALQKTPEYVDRQKSLAELELTKAKAQAAIPDAQLERDFKRAQIGKLNADAREAGKPKVTGDQYKVAGFVKRAEQAEDTLNQLLQSGYDPTTAGADIQGRALFPGILQSGEYKGFDQASRNFISAVLRRESGAAISDQEYANERAKYFPMPGDDKDVLAQKAAARAQAMAGLKAEAGGAYDLVPTVNAPKRTAKNNSGGLIESAQADQPQAPKSGIKVQGPRPGSIVEVQGKRYIVGDDGDSLKPL